MNTYQGFNKEELNYSDPLELFNSWFEEAKKLEIKRSQCDGTSNSEQRRTTKCQNGIT